MRRATGMGLGVMAAIWLAAAPAALADDAAVGIYDFSFAPGELVVAAGDTVTFTNGDRVAHTASGSGWDTGTLGAGARATVTFATTGTFAYTCRFHPAMRGTVVVEVASGAGGGDDPPETDAAAPAEAEGGDSLGPGWLLALAGLAGLAAPLRLQRRGRASRAPQANR